MIRKPMRIGRVACLSGLIKLLTVMMLSLASVAPLSAQVPPDETWRTLRTEHFRVTFPERLEGMGRAAADRAERAFEELSSAFSEPPDGLIDVLLTDHIDMSNGFAQYTPSNRITVYARPPVDDLALGYFDDWLELVITHELAHVVHLDRTGTWVGDLARGVFGRVNAPWPFFPASAVPRWVSEGLATWYESELTDAGRVRGTYHDMVLRTAALEGRFESIGQAAGGSPQWPEGTRAYAYGSLFFEHLLDKYGDERMDQFIEAVAGQWIPYRLDAAGRSSFGVSLSDEWAAWADQARSEAEGLDSELASLGAISAPERLTNNARWGLHPKVSTDGSALVYVRSNAKSDQQLVLANADGSEERTLTRTNQLATFDFTPTGDVLFAQLEFEDRYRAFSDLYLVSQSGVVTRVTTGARLTHPSVGGDGSWAIAVAEGEGTTSLVRIDLSNGEVEDLVASSDGVLWTFPSVSPDGRWIAVTRWTAGANQDVVILDAQGRVVHEVTSDRALDGAPDWSADGNYIVWSSDRTGILNVLGAPVDPQSGQAGTPVLLTNVRTGAAYPSLDPSGEWLYFSGYHVDGWEVERVAFDPAGLAPAPTADQRFAPRGAQPARGSADGEIQDYSPLSTLLPTYWEPILREPVETRTVQGDDVFIPGRELLGYAVGAQTGGVDLVGRHAYGALARIFTTGGKAEGGLSYMYSGLGNPVLGLRASQRWDDDGPRLARRNQGAPLDTLYVLKRERSVSASVSFSRPSWRRSTSLSFSGGVVWEDRELLDDALEPSAVYKLNRPGTQLSDFSASFYVSTARGHSFQMGGARGASLFVRARVRNELSLPDSLAGVVGSDRSTDEVIGRVQGYLPVDGPGFASHVFAVRGTFGVAHGPGADIGYFDVGGASGSGETVTGTNLFGGSPIFLPLRGYRTSIRSGRYAWSASAEYRVPLALFNWGLGAWPLHFDRVFGSVFADAGNAWGPDASPSGFANVRRDPLVSVGAEITAQVLTFYRVSMRVRTGVALPLVEGDGARIYLRIGVPF
ncbi:MAG: BamA/TamA family outer membrane protein [Gemmatimonadales bacterium]|nr:BamA/TamA family outer membrane protein [Gemmatimonadales bacterium]MBT3500648.1 BamA/TamA family outer membrane protein [Gemmatimonadales bacterium]MBT3773186.1 BamA/TamA family outer membrane protein [Gemmatimonadales bacterium]MBT3957565.1 BamA/TamA family outer membrane protein [Gemmatimonadales bacterium]MBT4186709.1 BamA/TamA family outer membrane protein [Gemmatimonadales bacterium]